MDKIVNIKDYEMLRDYIHFEDYDLKMKLVFMDNLVISFEGSEPNRTKFKFYRVVVRAMQTMKGYTLEEAHPFKLKVIWDNKTKDKKKRKIELQRVIPKTALPQNRRDALPHQASLSLAV